MGEIDGRPVVPLACIWAEGYSLVPGRLNGKCFLIEYCFNVNIPTVFHMLSDDVTLEAYKQFP